MYHLYILFLKIILQFLGHANKGNQRVCSGKMDKDLYEHV